MKKRGQFYIIASVLIILVLVGLATIINYAMPKKAIRIYDLAKELKIETGEVYDYGIYNKNDTNSLIENWADKYYGYSKLQENIEDWIFIYGDIEEITALTFTTANVGKVEIITGASNTEVPMQRNVKGKEKIKSKEKKVEIKFKNFAYPFELREGQNFYFVIKKEGYVARG